MKRKFKPRNFRRRNRFRRRPRRRLNANPARAMGPLSTKLMATMRYHDFVDLNPGVGGTPGHYVFSCNGLYDPNISGVGHQPRGFDQLMLLYDHYVVIGFKAEVFMHNTESAPQFVSLFISDTDSVVGLGANDIVENRFTKYRILSPSEAGGSSAKMTISVNPAKFLGRSRPLSDSQLKGSATANPTEQCYLIMSAYPRATSDTVPVVCSVRITYIAVFIEPKIVAQS